MYTKYSYSHFTQITLTEIERRLNRPIRILDFSHFFLDIPPLPLSETLPLEIEIIELPLLSPESIWQSTLDSMFKISRESNSFALFLHDFSTTEFGKRTIDKFKSGNIAVRVIESPIEIIKFARKQKDARFYLFIAGFEPLIAIIAASILAAHNEQLTNLYFLTELYQSNSFVPVLCTKQINPYDGIFVPGQIVAPLGHEVFANMVQELSVPIIITGTDVPDMLQSVSMLLAQLEQKVTKLEVQYRPGIRPQGNPMSRQKIESVFDLDDVTLPELGLIPKGRFIIKNNFAQYVIK